MSEATQTTENQPAQPEATQTQQPQPAQPESLLTQSQVWAPPEKYQVKTESGDMDWQQVAQKIGTSYSELEKAFSKRPVPPKEVSGYRAEIEGLDWDEYSKNPEAQSFMTRALEKGITNDQLSWMLNEHIQMEQSRYSGESIMSVDKAAESLKKVWGDSFDDKLGAAWTTTNALASKIGMSMADIDASGLGNNPAFLRMAAEISDLFGEDQPINTTGGAQAAESINDLILSEAYKNPKDPRHAEVSAKVKAHFEKKFK